MKKVLMISYHFPPEEGSCSDKNVKILSALIDADLSVDVLTVGLNSCGEKYKGAYISRVNAGFFHKYKNSTGCNDYIKNPLRTGIKQKAKSLVQRNIIPDSLIDWYPNVMTWAEANAQKMNEYAVILSISSPYSTHIISNKISKKYGIPYICAYGDPWIYEPSRKRGNIRYKFEYDLERKIITDAEKVLVITEYNKQKYRELYDIKNDKIDTYNIGFDANSIKKRLEDKREIRFIYGGSLNPIHRNVLPFLEASRHYNDLIVDIYNQDYPELFTLVRSYGIEKKVLIRDLIPGGKFNEELYKSDVLLLFGNRTVFQVPGKLFEYISTGTHILYIKNNYGDNDASEIILNDYGNVTVVDNTVEAIDSALANIFVKFNNRTLNSICHREAYEYHITMKSIVSAVRECVER